MTLKMEVTPLFLVTALFLIVTPLSFRNTVITIRSDQMHFHQTLSESAATLLVNKPELKDNSIYMINTKSASMTIYRQPLVFTLAIVRYTYQTTKSKKLQLLIDLIRKRYAGLLPTIVINLK